MLNQAVLPIRKYAVHAVLQLILGSFTRSEAVDWASSGSYANRSCTGDGVTDGGDLTTTLDECKALCEAHSPCSYITYFGPQGSGGTSRCRMSTTCEIQLTSVPAPGTADVYQMVRSATAADTAAVPTFAPTQLLTSGPLAAIQSASNASANALSQVVPSINATAQALLAGPTPLPAPTTPQISGVAGAVSVGFTVQGIDYNALSTEQVDSLTQALGDSVSAFTGVPTDNVKLQLSAGSVQVQGTISPTVNATVDKIQNTLTTDPGPQSFGAVVGLRLKQLAVPATGAISVSNLVAGTPASLTPPPTSPPPTASIPSNPTVAAPTYSTTLNMNAYDGHGAVNIDSDETAPIGYTLQQCQQRCTDDVTCSCVTLRTTDGTCWKRSACNASLWQPQAYYNVYVKDSAVTSDVVPQGSGVPPPAVETNTMQNTKDNHWPWWVWLLFGMAALLCISCVVWGLFRVCKKSKGARKRSAHVEGSDASEWSTVAPKEAGYAPMPLDAEIGRYTKPRQELQTLNGAYSSTMSAGDSMYSPMETMQNSSAADSFAPAYQQPPQAQSDMQWQQAAPQFQQFQAPQTQLQPPQTQWLQDPQYGFYSPQMQQPHMQQPQAQYDLQQPQMQQPQAQYGLQPPQTQYGGYAPPYAGQAPQAPLAGYGYAPVQTAAPVDENLMRERARAQANYEGCPMA